jgi:seryl-tRNA synthetase
MVKITKLSDLTDIEKLKQLGSSIVDPTKVSNLVDKVKSTVTEPGKMGELVGKMKSSVGLGEKTNTAVHPENQTDLQTQAAIIQQSLQALFEAQKQQLAIMNALKKQVNNLVASAMPVVKEEESTTESEVEQETEQHKPKDNIHDDTV